MFCLFTFDLFKRKEQNTLIEILIYHHKKRVALTTLNPASDSNESKTYTYDKDNK